MRGKQDSERDAFVFLRHRSAAGPEVQRLTYGALLARAQAVAGTLQQDHGRGDRALILAPPGLDYIAALLGCQLAGLTAVPAYPPRNARHIERLTAIAQDCGAAVVLTVMDLVDKLKQWWPGHLPAMIAVDALVADAAALWRDPLVRPEDLALLQYTSGTTGTPKGVMIDHSNLMANFAATAARCGFTCSDVHVTWLPPYHDLGLISGILQPIFFGQLTVAMTPAAFLQEPLRWLRAISEFRGTVSAAPNFAYELCCNIDPAVRLDLASWRCAVSGGEPPRASTIERFAQRFAPHGFSRNAFCPGYGLAETTLQVATRPIGAAPQVLSLVVPDAAGVAGPRTTAVSNGAPLDGHDVRIVNHESGRELPPGAVGEVWVAGPTVSRGYWNRPAETAEAFAAWLPPAGPFLRTGDLGALVDGELYVTGRLKETIIIRGRNHYAQDIEATVATAAPELGFDATIACGVEIDGTEALVIVHSLARNAVRNLDAASLFSAIRQAVVAAHDVDPHAIVLVRPAGLPRTTSGKLQRLKTRQMFLADQLPVVAAWSSKPAQVSTDVRPNPAVAQLLARPPSQRGTLLRRLLAERIGAALDLAEPPGERTGFAELGLELAEGGAAWRAAECRVTARSAAAGDRVVRSADHRSLGPPDRMPSRLCRPIEARSSRVPDVAGRAGRCGGARRAHAGGRGCRGVLAAAVRGPRRRNQGAKRPVRHRRMV